MNRRRNTSATGQTLPRSMRGRSTRGNAPTGRGSSY